MSPSSRFAAVAGTAVLALGLAACSAEPVDPGPDTSIPVEEPSDIGHDHGADDIAALVGDWELSPLEPHTKTPLTFSEDGTVESPAQEGALETRGFTGTFEPADGGFKVALISSDEEQLEWTLTLTEGAMAETWDAVDDKGLKYTMTRA